MNALLRDWAAAGERRDVFGHALFRRVAGPADAPWLLVLHGFPTCSLDFARALPHLAAHHRVLLHDHLGFGLSDKPARAAYSLVEQAEAAVEVWRQAGVRRGHLIAHDYGCSVATEVLALRERGLLPIELASVTLCNGSVLIELAQLRVIQKLLRNPRTGPLVARLSGRRVFGQQLRRILGRPDAVPDEELDALWEALARDDGRARLPALSRYLDERVRFRDRWFDAWARFDGPAHVLWARRDPIAVPAIAERLAAARPGVRLTWLEHLGHYPMLEDPAGWAAAVTDFTTR
jgi:pimeloyl-ACP methyl ester carboxylesterase